MSNCKSKKDLLDDVQGKCIGECGCDQDCERTRAIDQLARDLQANPKTAADFQKLGRLIGMIKDIVIANPEIADAMFGDQNLQFVAQCPNNTEYVVVEISMIHQLPAHELEMMQDF